MSMMPIDQRTCSFGMLRFNNMYYLVNEHAQALVYCRSTKHEMMHILILEIKTDWETIYVIKGVNY